MDNSHVQVLVAYFALEQVIIRSQGAGSRLKAAVGNDAKGKISVLLYLATIPLAFVHQLLSDAIYVSVALMWLIPDRRIEERFTDAEGEERL